jgi:hypothetical protein
VPDVITPSSTITLKVALASNTFESGAILRIGDLLAGWTAAEVDTGALDAGTSQREIEVTVPEGASGEFTITIEATAKDFVGTTQKTVTLLVGKAEEVAEEIGGEVPGPVETSAPALRQHPNPRRQPWNLEHRPPPGRRRKAASAGQV